MPPVPSRSDSRAKRKRHSEEDALAKRTRTAPSDSDELESPQRTTRSSTVEPPAPTRMNPRIIDLSTPVRRQPQKPQMAKRSVRFPATEPEPEPPQRRQKLEGVVIPTRRRTHSNGRAAAVATRTRGKPTSSGDTYEPESESADESYGTAGPGPRTARSRQRSGRRLSAIPQPSQSAFKPYLGAAADPSTQEDIVDFSSPPEAAGDYHGAESQSQSQPRARGERRIIDGEEVWVVVTDTEEESAGDDEDVFRCRWAECTEVFAAATELQRHARTHINTGALSASQTSSQLLRGKDMRVVELEQQLAHRDDEIDALNLKLRDGEERLKKLEQRTDAAEARMKAAEDRAVASEAKFKDEVEANAAVEEMAAAPIPDPDGPPPTQEEQLSQRESTITNLKRRLKDSNRSLKHTRNDLNFIRDQYQVASASAVSEVQRAKDLESQVARLQEQLTLGLKQRELHTAAANRAGDAAHRQLSMQVKLLLDQSRCTDDTIRRKAAAHARLLKENREFEAELHKTRGKVDELTERNNELSEQVALLRGRVMGAFEPVEAEVDSDETDDELPQGFGTQRVPSQVPVFAADDKPTPPPAVGNATLADGGMEAFRCKWALEGEVLCTEIFQAREELEAHGLGHIQKLAFEGL